MRSKLGFLVIIIVLTICFSQNAMAEFSIQQIDINQVIGIQKDNNLNFVAGKSTVIRALLNEKVTINESASKTIIKRDGQEVATLSPKSYS